MVHMHLFTCCISLPCFRNRWQPGLLLITTLFAGLPAFAQTTWKVLHYTETTGYNHGTKSKSFSMFQSWSATDNYIVVDDDDGSEFNSLSNLQQFAVVVFSNTSGNSGLSSAQRANFEAYINAGGSYLGIHAASDTYRHSSANGGKTGTWDWYAETVAGASVQEKPNHTSSNHNNTMTKQVANHPTLASIPNPWNKTEEYYYWEDGYLNNSFTELLRVGQTGNKSYDSPRRMAHCKNLTGGGRAFYTALGHSGSNFTSDVNFQNLIHDALLWCADPNISSGGGGTQTPPAVQMISPNNGGSFPAGSPIMVAASASDSDGSVTKVEFFSGNTLIGTVSNSPYQISWNNPTAGTYSLTAKATDDDGLSTTSQSVSITVTVSGGGGGGTTTPPQVSITAPAGGTTFTAGDNITITASASDSDGSVTKVEFFHSGVTLLATEMTAPYDFTWQNVQAGTYILTAKATDDDNLSTVSAPVTITVSLPISQQPPVVSLDKPVNGDSFNEGTNVVMEATASDPDGNVVKVEFWDGGNLLGSDATSPYTFTWQQPSAGIYDIKAVAIDNANLKTASSVAQVTIVGQQIPPVVSLITPANNAQFQQGDAVSIEASASDPDGSIASVEFYADNTLLGVENNAPYEIVWQNVPAGTYVMTAIATDDQGNVTTSQGITIIVNQNGSGGGNGHPTVQIIEPDDGAQYNKGDNIDVEAIASDPDGQIKRVEFFLNGNLYKTEKVSLYEAPLKNVQPGSYTLMAIAYDNDGKTDTAKVDYSVVAPLAGPPTVEIIDPLDGQVFNSGADVEVEATASDDGLVAKVEFYLDGKKWRTEYNAPYTGELDNMKSGIYLLMAIGYDNDGYTDTSVITFTVGSINPISPLVEIIDPLDGQQFNQGDDVEVEATATDSDGSIAKVEFYLDGNKWRTEKYAPYTGQLDNMQPGTYELMAIGYDNDGYRDSSVIVFTVGKVNPQPPLVQVIDPLDGTNFPVGTDIDIEVDASDPDGDIAKVEIYVDNDLIQTEKYYPYTATFENAQAGTYIIRAVAFDDDGLTTASNKVIVTVGSTPASVTDLTFEATVDEGLVILSWTAQEEENVAEYRLSRSSDSVVYGALSTLQAVGNSVVPTSYDEIDPDPFDGVSWYKLEALDGNGSVLDVRIVKVDLNDPGILEKWIVYPNPLQGDKPIKVWAMLAEDVGVTVELTSIFGQVFFQQNYQFFEGQNKLTVGLNTLPPGIYFFTLRITQSAEVLDTQLFIKTP